ncbi:hypothetical protein [Candidatus Stoquefichus massiliensis]|uniref:hypothetical protein n=1 Tax=Candidatus Stoquefichus massiliensis TaxID=1470350 RepID=UPI00048031AD|nr:hypothetical protein [Candidatus Stoquefichus massiliensis]
MDVESNIELIFPTLHKRHIIELMNYVTKRVGYQCTESDLKEYHQMLYWDKPENMDINLAFNIAMRLSDPGVRRIGKMILKVYIYIESENSYILTDDFLEGKHCLRGYRDDGQEVSYVNNQWMMGENVDKDCYEKLKLKCGK